VNWLKELRIAYVPFGPTFDFPGDRRRFCFYASARNLAFEIARPGETYDVVVLTQAADLTFWSSHPRGRTKIIFDFPDSYLSIPKFDGKAMLRGLAKFAVRQNQRLRLSYRSTLEAMCSRADATICCTPEQRERILPFSKNVHVILDAHFAVVRSFKDDYTADRVFHFVWEGLAHNLEHLSEIRDSLRDLLQKRPFLIHAITQLEYRKFLGGKLGRRNTVDEARKIWPEILLYTWNERTFSGIVRSCDMALIPIPQHDPFCTEKPENRVLLFWRAGMPVLASATAAHRRVMKECGLDMAPATNEDWRQALELYTSDEEARRHAGLTGRAFAETHYREENMLSLWDGAFQSLYNLPANHEARVATPSDPLDRADASRGQRGFSLKKLGHSLL
jgi:glycosyltransferase involved in cell wall biosynthesis